MRHSICSNLLRFISTFTLLAALCMTTAVAQADSHFITSIANGYRADDYLYDLDFDTFSMIDQNTALISMGRFEEEKNLKIVDLVSGNTVLSLGQPNDSYFSDNTKVNGDEIHFDLYTSFAKKSPDGGSYWVGFTKGDNSDDRIYQVSSSTKKWTLHATLAANTDLQFYGDDLFVSANPNGCSTWEGLNQIFKLDTSLDQDSQQPNNNHQVIANTYDYSAGIGASEGSSPNGFYYAAGYDTAEKGLYHFSDQKVQSVLTGGPAIELSPADKLCSASLTACDTEVDSAGHVLFDANNFGNRAELLLYDEAHPTEVLTVAANNTGMWFGDLDIEGDLLTAGGSAYMRTIEYYEGWVLHQSITKITKLLPGDANGDGKVDGSDVAVLAGNWQHGVGSIADATWTLGDFNGNGVVDGSDVAILAGNWQASILGGSDTANVAVPEPSMIVLLVALAVMVGFRRRRS